MNHKSNRNDRSVGREHGRGETPDFDFLLEEVVGGHAPPDLSAKILMRLPQISDDVPPAVTTPLAEPAGREADSASMFPTSMFPKRSVVLMATCATAIAAALLIVVSFRSDRSDDDPAPVAESNQPTKQQLARSGGDSATVDRGSGEYPPETSGERSKTEIRGIPLVVGPSHSEPSGAPSEAAQRPDREPVQGTRADRITLVSRRVSNGLRQYWQAIGVQPFPERSADQTARHLEANLRVKLTAAALQDVEVLRAKLSQRDVSRAIARQWLEQLTEGGLRRINEGAQTALVDELAACVRGEQRFDQRLAEWISGRPETSSAWYQAVSKGGGESMVNRLASLTMNVDLRCTRCHDALIEGTGRQEDYWSFAGLIKRDVRHLGKGQWRVSGNRSDEPAFYSLPDGRQRMIEPAVPASWLGTDRPPTTVTEWSERLVGNPVLAESVVNSLWKLVHGRPLRGRVVDAVCAPHDQTLEQLQQMLVADTTSSNFDIGRTLAVVMATPAIRRRVPEAMSPAGALAADEDARSKAEEATGAFAAAIPPRSDRLSMPGRLRLVMKSAGASLGQLRDEEQLLAQPASRGQDRPGTSKTRSGRTVPIDFPTHAESLPVQWLGAIDDYEMRVQHLSYLAGRTQVPETVWDAAEAMREAEIDETLTLQRIWWLLGP